MIEGAEGPGTTVARAQAMLAALPPARRLIMLPPLLWAHLVYFIGKCVPDSRENKEKMAERFAAQVEEILARDGAVKALAAWLPFLAPICLLVMPKHIFAVVFILVMAQAVAPFVSAILPGRWHRCGQNPFSKRIDECLHLIRPFIFWGIWLSSAFNAVCLMALYHGAKLLGLRRKEHSQGAFASCLRLRQQKPKAVHLDECNFYHSPAFPATGAVIAIAGLPALLTLFIIMGTPVWFSRGWPGGAEDMAGLFCICYFSVLGAVVAQLFFREYFTFPARFASTEYDVELDRDGVKRLPLKGWFAGWLFYGIPEYCPREMPWRDVECIGFEQAGFGKMSPLPASLLPETNPVQRCLSRLAEIVDAVTERAGRAEYAVIQSAYDKRFSGGIRIRLWDLSPKERWLLYLYLCRHTASERLSGRLRRELIGTERIFDCPYDEDWFDAEGAAASLDLPALPPGSVLRQGKLMIGAVLSDAGVLRVYKVTDVSGRDLLLKEYPLACRGDFGAFLSLTESFKREREAMLALGGRVTGELLEWFVENNRACLVIKQESGQSLRQLINNEGKLPVRKAVGIAIELCRQVMEAHNCHPPLVLRNLCPDNVQVCANGHVQPVDLSGAVAVGQRPHDAEVSIAYCAPEQFAGAFGIQSDVYSIGAILSFLLTGTDPGPIGSEEAFSGVPEELRRILANAMTVYPSDRTESAEWLYTELKALATPLESPGVTLVVGDYPDYSR